MNDLTKKGLAVLAGVVLIGAGFGAAKVTDNHDDVIAELNEKVSALENAEPVVVTETVEVEVPVEKIVEVEVESENLDLVLEHIYDNRGNIRYITSDLDDDELDEIVERVIFINEAKQMALDEVKDDLFDEIDGEIVGSVELDDRDMERLRLDDDADELLVSNVDFDNKDVDITVTGTFEQDDVKYNFEAVVEIKDGEVEGIDDFTVTEA